jgi:hypothetical protein
MTFELMRVRYAVALPCTGSNTSPPKPPPQPPDTRALATQLEFPCTTKPTVCIESCNVAATTPPADEYDGFEYAALPVETTAYPLLYCPATGFTAYTSGWLDIIPSVALQCRIIRRWVILSAMRLDDSCDESSSSRQNSRLGMHLFNARSAAPKATPTSRALTADTATMRA